MPPRVLGSEPLHLHVHDRRQSESSAGSITIPPSIDTTPGATSLFMGTTTTEGIINTTPSPASGSGSGDINATDISNYTVTWTPTTLTVTLSTEPASGTSVSRLADKSGGISTILVAVLTVLPGIICGLAVWWCVRRRKRAARLWRGIPLPSDNDKHYSSGPSPSSPAARGYGGSRHTPSPSVYSAATTAGPGLFPVYFPADGEGAEPSPLSATEEKRAMLKGQDPFASSADITSASALHRSSTPSTAVASSSGTGEVEQAFQKSLRARAERMGLSPQQLLMLLTTSLDTSDTPFDGDAGSVRSGTISARWRETSEYAPSETVYSDVGTIPSSTGALGRRGSNARLSQSLPS